ncbi:MAG: histidine kinase [Flavobacterium sp.]|nr:histidine kinase [Flavobacterium sp.]
MKSHFILFFSFFYATFWAQDPYSITYSFNEGFPTSTVYSASQDKNGLLWFSTDVGIVKYDSHKFELINTDKGLSDNEVFQMKTDFKGRTWLLTLTGKLSFIYQNKIYNESNSSLVKKASGSSITVDFYQDNANNIYISYRNGEIAVIKPNNEVEKKYSDELSLAGLWKDNNAIRILNRHICDLETQKKLFSFPKNSFLKVHHHSVFGDYLSNTNVFYKVTANNQLEKIIEIPKPVEILNSFFENKNKLWICARNGLFLVSNNKIEKSFFKDFAITSITKDFEGGYWFSTLNNGIIYIPSFNFYVDKLNQNKTTKLNCISINAKNEIWVGGMNNDYYVKNSNSPFVKKELMQSERTDKITNIRFEDNATYVIGKLGIKKIDSKGNERLLGFSANDLLIDNKLAYIGYTYTLVLPREEMNPYDPKKTTPEVVVNKRSNIFTKDQNSIWIGTNNGLYQLSKNKTLTNWGDKNKNLQSSIKDLFYDFESKTLFIATASKGMLTINNNKISQFAIKDGLNSNICNSIKKISATDYLVGTNNGLNLLTLTNNQFKLQNLNAILSLKNNRINDIDYLNNVIYLATQSGLLYFNITDVSTKKNKPICHILKIVSNGKTIQDNAVLSYDKKNISIEFNGISFLNQGNLSYYYKLNNKNETWTKSSESKINYQSLPAGKYVFSVYCMDGFNVKSDVQSISFEILPPFWQKAWFIVCLILLAILGIYLFIRYRLNHQKKKFEAEKVKMQVERDKIQLEKQMVELEQKALRMQMNPHFIFNALNTIKGYYTEGNYINASTYISKFSKLLRKLLESEEQVTTLDNEIEMLKLYIELTQIRYEGKFDFEIKVDPDLSKEDILIPNLLLQPLVENAIIHGLGPKPMKGMLYINFIKKEELLICEVDDDGIGREASSKNQKNKEYSSKAMEITTERLKLFDTTSSMEIIDKKDSNNTNSGTKVIITIPLRYNW